MKIILILYPHCHPETKGRTIKNKQKNKYVFIYEIIRLIIMKMEKKNKNRSCIYDINRHKYLDTNIVNIKCLIMIMLICTKQNLSNI